MLTDGPGVVEANVYGVAVPGAEGRAGMAALVLRSAFDGPAFFRYVAGALPDYAQPRFVRISAALEITHTFKHTKANLKTDGYDPDRVSDPLFVRDPRSSTYVPLTPELKTAVDEGRWPV